MGSSTATPAARDDMSLGRRLSAAIVDCLPTWGGNARATHAGTMIQAHRTLDRWANLRGRDARPNAATEWIRLGSPMSVVGDGRASWSIALDDGRVVPLDVTVLLGRNPQRRPEDPITQLVPSSGDGRTIDRTHVMIGLDTLGVFVLDRDSSTGTAVLLQDGSLEELQPELKRYVGDGQRVVYGERWFIVQREEPR